MYILRTKTVPTGIKEIGWFQTDLKINKDIWHQDLNSILS